jgi:glucosyl-3-phosphoglycerate synthase
MLRSFHHCDFTVERLVEAKRGATVSVCLPARDEEATVGRVVEVIRTQLMDGALMDGAPLVDELVVIDDGSTDATASVAAAAGAEVHAAAGILPTYGEEAGKGQAMWKGLHVTDGDIVVFCDTDVTNFAAHFVTGLLGPLLLWDDVAFAKAFYRRPLDGRQGEGGRVTELVARPLISLLFPHLESLTQPLAGECAGRRNVLERVPFVDGYGVDLGLLIDVARQLGAASIVQCDLGERIHRNRPLSELAPQATAIIQLALSRAGELAPARSIGQRPPLADVPAHRKTA